MRLRSAVFFGRCGVIKYGGECCGGGYGQALAIQVEMVEP